jgi:hypothetical protein
MLPNPRKIKRIVNLFLLNLAILQNDESLSEIIKKDVLARFIVIQVQDYDLYLAILRNHVLPKLLSMVYRKEISLNDDPAWDYLREQKNKIHDLCMLYYHPASWLEHIFKPGDVFPHEKELEPYFNMLGRGERL